MATTKSQAIETPSRPLIQIDDLVREMTNEEYAEYQMTESSNVPIIVAEA